MADISFLGAAQAYAKGLARLGEAGEALASRSSGGSDSTDFGKLVGEALQAARAASLSAESHAIKAINGEAALQDVVAAIANAEVTLQTVVTVRDRVISAYQDIMRMPI